MKQVSVFVPNEVEQMITGMPTSTLEEVQQAGENCSRGMKTVLVTLGSKGAMPLKRGSPGVPCS